MAIHVEETQQFSAAAAARNVQEAAPTISSPISFNKGFGSSNNSITRTSTSVTLSKAVKAIDKCTVDVGLNKIYSVSFHTISTEGTTLAYPCIVVCVTLKENKEMGVAYHVIILEESEGARTRETKVEHFMNEPYEIMIFGCDAYDQIYDTYVSTEVNKAYPGIKQFAMQAEVVPRGFKWDDEFLVDALTRNALLACINGIGKEAKLLDQVNLVENTKEESLFARINYNEPPRLDWLGLPIRNDFCTYLYSNSNSNKTNTINMQAQQQNVCRAGGYIDPVWVFNEQQWQMEMARNQFYGGANLVAPKFVANIVLTTLEHDRLQTLTAQLTALIGPIMLKENDAWISYFVPRKRLNGGNKIDLKDIGAINIEGNCSNNPDLFDIHIDTTGANFGEPQTWQLCRKLFKPGAVYSLRVSESGADTWYNSAFLSAATEVDMKKKTDAINAICDAADALTNGAFFKRYRRGANPMIDSHSVVHTGYYIDQDGQKRDIADVDYLAIMNFIGKNDRTAGAQWQATFNDLSKDTRYLLARRRKMIEAVLGTNVVYTGRAKIVTFNSEFINAFALAVTDCTRINASNANMGFDSSVRPIMQGIEQAIVNNSVTSMFTHGNNQVFQNRGSSYVGRTNW